MIRNTITIIMLVAATGSAAPAVSKLKGEYRNGQVFLTWKEAPVPEGTTFNVYMSPKPIINETALAAAKKVCQWIEHQSAEDWTRDKGNYGKGRVKDKKTGKIPLTPPPVGFIIKEGGERLDPTSGLHVHTVAEEGDRYYAVTKVLKGAEEDRATVAGENSLSAPVAQKREQIQPIWQDKGKSPVAGSGKGKPLFVSLHAKGNRAACKYIVFGDGTHCWREGVPFMFDVNVRGDKVLLTPSNTMFIGRYFKRGLAAKSDIRGIWSFWYGCSDKIAEPDKIPTGTPTNYSEKRLLFEIDWIKRYLGTDPNRSYCSGSSMGGCGTMSFGFRHPEIFAACSAHVPIVAYNPGDKKKGRKLGWYDNTFRLTAFCGPLSLTSSDGLPLSKRLDATDFVLSHPGDLPFLIIANGRQDGSIPWHNCPPLYRALQTMRQGCLVAWNDGTHSGVTGLLPADFTEWKTKKLLRFALNKSYPAFSNCSRNNDPGNDDSDNGTTEGYINRGLDWQDATEDANRYEMLITYDLEAKNLPLTVDVTPRRHQAFKLSPGQGCTAVNKDVAGKEIQRLKLKADKFGLITFPKFQLTQSKGNRLILTKN
jgi:hypothetical protein